VVQRQGTSLALAVTNACIHIHDAAVIGQVCACVLKLDIDEVDVALDLAPDYLFTLCSIGTLPHIVTGHIGDIIVYECVNNSSGMTKTFIGSKHAASIVR
jgi:hypothetical protein